MWRRAPSRLFSGTSAAHPVQEAARAGDGAAQAVQLAQLAGADPHQSDQVVGLPEPVDVGLAEPDAAPQDGLQAAGSWIVTVARSSAPGRAEARAGGSPSTTSIRPARMRRRTSGTTARAILSPIALPSHP